MHRFYQASYRQYGGLTHTILRRLYHWRTRSWVRAFGSSGMALEVGCGAGWMLRALRPQGWTVVGNERTVQSTASASRVNGLPIFVGNLAALKPEPRFDLIILFQVLEHLPDPLATLQQCVRLLKPGGNLVIAVPNLESWQARLTGRSWFHLDVPRHLFHFSPRSLSQVLRQTGLTVNCIRFVSFEHDPYGWGQSVLNLLGFEQNLLTKVLMGMDRQALLSLAGLTMMFVGGLLLFPSLLLAVGSWLAGAGASVEILAVKPIPDGQAQVSR
jgi:SAM-dependent methyltransferase